MRQSLGFPILIALNFCLSLLREYDLIQESYQELSSLSIMVTVFDGMYCFTKDKKAEVKSSQSSSSSQCSKLIQSNVATFLP